MGFMKHGISTKKICLLMLTAVAVACSFACAKKNTAAQVETTNEFSDEDYVHYFDSKKAALEKILGKMDDLVGRAAIPFTEGGAVDMFYFSNGIPGTGLATMELLTPVNNGLLAGKTGAYELVAFTKQRFPEPGKENDESQPFNIIERRLCGIMTSIGIYSLQASLKPGDTCEIPENEGGSERCLILDEYDPSGKDFVIENRKYRLLLCMEIFRDEMEYAMEFGSSALIEKLKAAGYYPYSDMDRKSAI